MIAELNVPRLVEKPGCVVVTGIPTLMKATAVCSNCGKEFHPISNLRGGRMYELILRKKGATVVSKYGVRFHFADTHEFKNHDRTIHLACCSHTCKAQIENVNEDNLIQIASQAMGER